MHRYKLINKFLSDRAVDYEKSMQIKETYVHDFYGSQRTDILIMLMKKN